MSITVWHIADKKHVLQSIMWKAISSCLKWSSYLYFFHNPSFLKNKARCSLRRLFWKLWPEGLLLNVDVTDTCYNGFRGRSFIHSSKTKNRSVASSSGLVVQVKRTTGNLQSCQFSMRKSSEAFGVRSSMRRGSISHDRELLQPKRRFRFAHQTRFSFCVAKWRQTFPL